MSEVRRRGPLLRSTPKRACGIAANAAWAATLSSWSNILTVRLYRRLHDVDRRAVTEAERQGSRACDAPKKIVAAKFEYCDESGAVAFVVERVEYQNRDGSFVIKDGKRKKTFRQKRPDPDQPSEWIWNVDGVPVLPYRLPEVIEAIAAGHPVLVVEGERKADLLWSWNIAATCNAGGAKKWKPEHAEFLRGADVVLVPDQR